MKNVILSMMLVSSLAVSAGEVTTNSCNETVTFETISVAATEVSTFCKLITKGDLEAVKSMIAAGTNINKKSVGMTPIMYAARYNRVEIVNLLIARGADLKIKSSKGYTALEYAKMSKAKDTYKVISEHLDVKMKKKRKKATL